MLSVASGLGEGEAYGPVTDPGTGSSTEDTSTTSTGATSGPVYGPTLPNQNPVVTQVNVALTPVQTLTVTFSREVAAGALIANGSIVSAVSLTNFLRGPVNLEASQFTYDQTTHQLTLVFSSPLPGGGLADGLYELRLDGSRFADAAGHLLCGEQAGLLFAAPSFAAAVTLPAADSEAQVNGYSVPSLADWNGDGVLDLIVGEKTAAGDGKIRVFLNTGNNPTPVYQASQYALNGAGGDLSVPASGCLGVFVRVFDWNRDGRQDLVLGLADGSVLVTLNENTVGEPRFGTPLALQVGPSDAKISLDVGDRATLDLVDWNDDGSFDVVFGGLDGKVHVLLNATSAGLPDFRTDTLLSDGADVLTVPSGRSSVAVTDLNGDGRKDLVTGNTEGQLLFFANVGTDAEPRFGGSVLLQADGATIDLEGTPRSRPFVGDVTRDGVLDLLVGAADGRVRLYVGESTTPASMEGQAGGLYSYAFRIPPAEDANPWQNAAHPLDVNNDGFYTPLDALIVANFINANGAGTLRWPTGDSSPLAYVDCAGDWKITPQDALLVINDLNAHGAREVTATAGTDCSDTPVCTPAGEAGDLEDILTAIAAQLSAAGLR